MQCISPSIKFLSAKKGLSLFPSSERRLLEPFPPALFSFANCCSPLEFFFLSAKKRCNLPVDGGVWAKAIVINKQRLLLLRLVIFIIYLLASIIQQQVHFLQNKFLKSPITYKLNIPEKAKTKPFEKTKSSVFLYKKTKF